MLNSFLMTRNVAMLHGLCVTVLQRNLPLYHGISCQLLWRHFATFWLCWWSDKTACARIAGLCYGSNAEGTTHESNGGGGASDSESRIAISHLDELTISELCMTVSD